MQAKIKKLVVIGLQQAFLQMVYDQIIELTQKKIQVRIVSLNELHENPLSEDETVLYFSKGLKTIVETMSPGCRHYIYARRENFITNMRPLFALDRSQKILVVNDVKTNTDELTKDLESLGLSHTFFAYYPNDPLPDHIDRVVTAGERSLVPSSLKDKPIIDLGLRFVSLETVYELFDHFKLAYTHAALARYYMRTMMMLSEKWPFFGKDRFRRPAWFGTRKDTSAAFTFEDLILKSSAMKSFCRETKKLAATALPIHVYGRIGTGKTQISQAIHNFSPFADQPFISINCAARTAETLERELFGWEDGARTYKSLFETAENGTLCIEEIGKLPEKLQAGLLQAVTEKKIIRANGSGVVDIHARLVTTASQKIEHLSASEFNPELLLGITHYVCRVPDLSERMEDFRPLVLDYLENQLKKPGMIVPEETFEALVAHKWEGNVQELYNVLQHAACMSETVLDKKNLPYYLTRDRVSTNPVTIDPTLDKDFSAITRDITAHGFLEESREILEIYQLGKQQNQAYGRTTVLNLLQKKGFRLSKQQLRLKLERMDKFGLLIVRPGRGGTTLSSKGGKYLNALNTGPV